ncbi:MAG: metallophosphoesterase family protein, partial [Peptococcaceae bacterium]|nr:metallophosphoesterase family protein [Peptococcaceae bacterium]
MQKKIRRSAISMLLAAMIVFSLFAGMIPAAAVADVSDDPVREVISAWEYGNSNNAIQNSIGNNAVERNSIDRIVAVGANVGAYRQGTSLFLNKDGLPGTEKYMLVGSSSLISTGTLASGGAEGTNPGLRYPGYFQFEISTRGCTDIVVNARTRSSAAGPRYLVWQYSLSGEDGSFTNFGNVFDADLETSLAVAMEETSLPEACFNQEKIYLRLAMERDHRNSASGTIGSGTWGINDIVFSGMINTLEIELIEPEALTLQPGATASDINFAWHGDRDDSVASYVQIAKKSAVEGNNFPVSTLTVEGAAGDASPGKSWHKVSVTGLERNTAYAYRVSNDGTTYSKVYGFKTGAVGSFQFVAVGDPQLTLGNQDSDSVWPDPIKTTKEGWQDTLDRISQIAPNAAFIAGTGDQVDTQAGMTGANQATVEAEYANYFAPEQLRSLPIAPAVGNHELTGNAWPNTKTDNFNRHFNLPNEDTSIADFAGNYWYAYNDALFVVLDTAPYPTNGDQTASLIAVYDAVLAEATAASPESKWLFVQHHKTTASPASHQTDADVLLYAPQFNALMDKHSVDFVLAGHDHVYSRSWAIRDNQKVEADYTGNSITDPQGTIYFSLTTASGLKYYDFLQNAPAAPVWVDDTRGMYTERKSGPNAINGKPWYTNVGIQVKAPQFTTVDVTEDSVTFKTYRTDTMAVIDEYTVIKTEEPSGRMVIAAWNYGGSNSAVSTNIAINAAELDEGGRAIALGANAGVFKEGTSLFLNKDGLPSTEKYILVGSSSLISTGTVGSGGVGSSPGLRYPGYFQFEISTTGCTDIVVDARTRSSAAGPRYLVWQYSLTGEDSSFTSFGSTFDANLETSLALSMEETRLPEECFDQA